MKAISSFRRYRACFWVLSVITTVMLANSAWAGLGVDWIISKTAPPTVLPGDDITYTMVITNNIGIANDVEVLDTLPPNTTFVSLNITGDGAFTTTTPAFGGTGLIDCTASNYPAFGSSTLTLVVNVDPATPDGTTITNTATVASTTANANDNNLNDNTSIVDVLVGVPICGNGTVEPGETCDDGNASNGDCCDSTCQLEAQGSSCDDANSNTINDSCNGAGLCAGQPPAGQPPTGTPPSVTPQASTLEGACALNAEAVPNLFGFLGFALTLGALGWRRLRS